MLYPMLAVALAFCGIAVLGVLAARVLAEVRRLARQVEESSHRITRASEDLERAAVPLAARAARVGQGAHGDR
ncbi:hypothetical protein [Streptomyces luteireticuli]|uniref:DUF948 domain-containing protein n=1 Tax=Streptomyces luteireticuli TaxID=173858 RepID=A0ABN0YZ34_9ACTN